MDLNQLVPEADWVSKQNENIDKLSVKSTRSTAIVGLNGWSLDGTDNYVMTVPGLDNTLKILHVTLKKDGVVPSQPQDIMILPDGFGSGTPRGIYMNPDINNGGSFGGHLVMYFEDSTKIGGDLIPISGQTQTQNVNVSFSFLYW